MGGIHSNGANISGVAWRASALALSLGAVAGTADAQAVRRVDVSGYVAERCWTAGPVAASDPAVPGRFKWTSPARCNTAAAPALKVRLRDVTSEGALAPLRVVDSKTLARDPAQSPTAEREALEIFISPTP